VPLADADRYETPPNPRRSLLSRLTPWPELSFYLPVLRIVLRSSRYAVAGRYDGPRWILESSRILEAMEAVGMKVVVEGMDQLRSFDGPCVFVANHMSTLETFVLPAILHPVKPISFVVKESLVRVPVFGPIMRSRDPICVGRKNPRDDLAAVLRGGEERAKKGISLVIFPQTTRANRFSPDAFNSLAAKLAVRLDLPLVPVALRTDAWGTGRLIRDFGPVDPRKPVRFRIGTPLAPKGKGAEAHEASARFISTALREWGCEVQDAPSSPPG
jgi:1-acyl-sn-glycerol-3-phosphate acyltransferase